MPVRSKVVVHPADIGHLEPVGVLQFAALREEQAGNHALADRLAVEPGFHGVGVRLYDGGELARVVAAKPAFVHIHRVRAIQKILETRFHGSFKARLHAKRRPALLSVLCKMIRKGFGYRRAEKNPDKTVLLDGRKSPYSMVRNAGVSPQRRHRLERTGAVESPAVILAFDAAVDGLSLGKFQIAVRAAVLKSRRLSSFVAEENKLFPVQLQADRLLL